MSSSIVCLLCYSSGRVNCTTIFQLQGIPTFRLDCILLAGFTKGGHLNIDMLLLSFPVISLLKIMHSWIYTPCYRCSFVLLALRGLAVHQHNMFHEHGWVLWKCTLYWKCWSYENPWYECQLSVLLFAITSRECRSWSVPSWDIGTAFIFGMVSLGSSIFMWHQYWTLWPWSWPCDPGRSYGDKVLHKNILCP